MYDDSGHELAAVREEFFCVCVRDGDPIPCIFFSLFQAFLCPSGYLLML